MRHSWRESGQNELTPTQPSESVWRQSGSAAPFVECTCTIFQKTHPGHNTHTHWNTSQVQRTSKQKNPCGGLSGSSDAKMTKGSWLTRTWLYRGVSLLQKKSSMDQAAVHLREVSYSGQVQRHSSNTTAYIYTMNRGGHLTVPEWMGLITDHEWKLLNTSYIGWKSLNIGMST